MTQKITLPELGEGIESGTIISLLVEEGSIIKQGDTLAEIETEKAVLGIPSSLSGKLVKWHIKEGVDIKKGDVLCSIDQTNEDSTKTDTSDDNENNKKEKKEKAPRPSTDSKADTVSKKTSPSTENNTEKIEEIYFADLGDGIKTATITALHVQIGDSISQGDHLVELETDKAVVPYPSPISGSIKEILIKEGDEIKVGDKGFILSTVSEATEPQTQSATEEEQPLEQVEAPSSQSAPEPNDEPLEEVPKQTELANHPSQNSNPYAGPAARKLARELGVRLDLIKGSGRSGRIMVEDVKQYTKHTIQGMNTSFPTTDLPDFSKWGEIKVEKVSKLRKTIAHSISRSWQSIPHVHQFDNINIDNITALQKKWKKDFEEQGSVLSVTPFIIKALASCLKKYPHFNSSYDSTNQQIILKNYFHIGVAVDTPQGLIVPVIKDVDKMNIFEIGIQLKTIAAKTRDRTVKPEDLKGSCITLSNLGGIGGSHFNPIINWPEVAILGVGRNEIRPIYDRDNNQFTPATILPVCLAYDHRVIDGADGARFIVLLKQYLENPNILLLGISG